MNPTVSICMPTYNGEEFLRDAIESALGQSYSDLELIVCDDGSGDSTLQIAREYAQEDARVIVVSNDETQGAEENWNYCMGLARGSFIQFLFQDDVLEEQCVERKAGVLADDAATVLCFSASKVIDGTGKVTMKRRPFKGDQVFDGREIAKTSFLSKNVFGEPSNVMFRKSLVSSAGGFNTDLCYYVDWEYWIRLSLCGKVAYLDESLSRFRVSGGSTTSDLYGGKDKRLEDDDNVFIASVSGLEGLGLSDADVKKHQRSIRMRSFARRVYFSLHK